MSDCRFGVSPVNYPDPDPEGRDVNKHTDTLKVNSFTNTSINCTKITFNGRLVKISKLQFCVKYLEIYIFYQK